MIKQRLIISYQVVSDNLLGFFFFFFFLEGHDNLLVM